MVAERQKKGLLDGLDPETEDDTDTDGTDSPGPGKT